MNTAQQAQLKHQILTAETNQMKKKDIKVLAEQYLKDNYLGLEATYKITANNNWLPEFVKFYIDGELEEIAVVLNGEIVERELATEIIGSLFN